MPKNGTGLLKVGVVLGVGYGIGSGDGKRVGMGIGSDADGVEKEAGVGSRVARTTSGEHGLGS